MANIINYINLESIQCDFSDEYNKDHELDVSCRFNNLNGEVHIQVEGGMLGGGPGDWKYDWSAINLNRTELIKVINALQKGLKEFPIQRVLE